MERKPLLSSGWFSCVQMVLALCWLSNLKQTTAYFFVYCLIAMAGILAILHNRSRDPQLPRHQVLGSAVIGAVFSFMCLFSNYELFSPLNVLKNLVNITTGLAGGFFIGWNILLCLSRLLPATHRAADDRSHPRKFFLACFASIAAIDLVYLFFCAFPGTLTLDSINQLNQIHTGTYINWHPYWHTMVLRFWTVLGKGLFGSWQAGVALFSIFQIFLMAAAISYPLVTLYSRGFPRWCLMTLWAAYALLPYNIAYSSTMWKDVLFGAACLVLVTSLYRLLTGGQEKRRTDVFLFALSGLLLCLWRSNGLPAYALLLVILAVFFRHRRKLLKVMALVLLAGILLTGPVLSALGVAECNYVEALSIPLQQVARVIHDEKPLTEEERLLVETVAEEEVIREAYLPWLSDPIKNLLRASPAEEKILEDPMPYLKLWVNLGLKYPAEYGKAWIDQTKGYWNCGYSYWIIAEGVYENELGITAAGPANPVKTALHLYFRYFQLTDFLTPLISIGLHSWLMVLCVWLNHTQKRKEWILPLPILAILASLIISTPVSSEFRYIYSMFLAAPLIFAVTCIQVPEETE